MLGGLESVKLVECATQSFEFEKEGLIFGSCFTVLHNKYGHVL